MLTITIDWLACTFKDIYDQNGELKNNVKEFTDKYASSAPVQAEQAHNGYNQSTVDHNGVRVSWNTDREEMGYHVIFAGSSLRNIVERDQVHVETLLRDTLHSGGSITRLDIAKDLRGQQNDIKEIYRSLEQNGNRGTARLWREINQNDGGYTLYVGSRESERYIRIYDKAAESGVSGQLWSRFEIETKGMVARALATTIYNTGRIDNVFDTVAKAMVKPTECRAYEQFFVKGVVPIALPKIEKQTDREKWIETQVIPAVLKHYIENPDSESVARLIASLQYVDRNRSDELDSNDITD